MKQKAAILIFVISILFITSTYWRIRENNFHKEFYSVNSNEILAAEILATRINYKKIELQEEKLIIKDPKSIEMILFEVRNAEDYEPNHPAYNNKFLLTLKTKSGKIFNAELNTLENDEIIYIYQIKKGFGTSFFKSLKSRKLYELLKSEKLI